MKKTSGWRRWVPVAGTLLSLLVFLATYYLDPLNFGRTQPISSLPAFLFSVLVLIASQQLALFSEVDSMSQRMTSTLESVVGQVGVAQIGDPVTAISYVVSRLDRVDRVRNTSFTLEMESEAATENLYAHNEFTDFEDSMVSFAKKPNIWRDIGDRFAVGRFREIEKRALSKHPEGGLDEVSPFGYQYRILNSDPQMNFILLSYSDSKDVEVLFNWDFRRTGKDNPTIFSSKDQRIVDMFEAHFDLLWERSTIDHDANTTRSSSTM